MNGTLLSDALDWTGKGYSFAPLVPNDPELLANPEAKAWQRVESILSDAKRGRFDKVAELFEIYDTSGPVLRYVCASVLGDVGHSQCFSVLKERSADKSNRAVQLDYVMALVNWGKLSVAPFVLSVFRRVQGTEEAEAFPLLLSMLLEEEWGEISDMPEPSDFESYGQTVMNRVLLLKEQFNSEDALVFHGGLASVRREAQLLLTRIQGTEYFDSVSIPILRRRFEAATGIDCSQFYREDKLQPLVVAAIVEEFLDSAEAREFKEGVRYFFGHRIPD